MGKRRDPKYKKVMRCCYSGELVNGGEILKRKYALDFIKKQGYILQHLPRVRKALFPVFAFLFLFSIFSLASAGFGYDGYVLPTLIKEEVIVDLLPLDNEWIGTNDFGDDVVFSGEVDGTKVWFQMATIENLNISNCCGGQTGTINQTNNYAPRNNTGGTWGLYAGSSGSLASLTANFDLTAYTGSGFGVLSMSILKDGIVIASQTCSTGVAESKYCRATWARDTYVFAVADALSAEWRVETFGGIRYVQIDETQMVLGLYLDS